MAELLKEFKRNPVLYVLVLAVVIVVIGTNEVLSFTTLIIAKSEWFVNTLLFLLATGAIGFYLLKIRKWR